MEKPLLKKILLSSLALTLVVSPLAQAKKAKHHRYKEQYDYAKVTHVSPRYETVRYSEPYEQCHYEERVVRHNDSKTPMILGSIIGAAIGNELGHKKRNKQVGAVTGAILGGSIGHDIAKRKRGYHVRDERVCKTAYEVRHREEVTGYDVEYRYRGLTYYTVMDERPGKRIRVAVSVRPVR